MPPIDREEPLWDRTRPPQINPKSPQLDRTHFSWIDRDELPSNQMRAPLIN